MAAVDPSGRRSRVRRPPASSTARPAMREPATPAGRVGPVRRGPPVAHLHHHAGARAPAAHLDRPAAVLDGVGHQVGDRLRQPATVGAHQRGWPLPPQPQRPAVRSGRGSPAGRAGAQEALDRQHGIRAGARAGPTVPLRGPRAPPPAAPALSRMPAPGGCRRARGAARPPPARWWWRSLEARVGPPPRAPSARRCLTRPAAQSRRERPPGQRQQHRHRHSASVSL